MENAATLISVAGGTAVLTSDFSVPTASIVTSIASNCMSQGLAGMLTETVPEPTCVSLAPVRRPRGG